MNVLRLTFSLEENAQHSLDLSSAVNLKSVMFQCGMPCLDVNWIKIAVESIKSSHIRMMTLDMSDFTTRENVVPQVPDAVYIQWLALDKVLVEYLTARSLKLNVTSPPGKIMPRLGVGWSACCRTCPGRRCWKWVELCGHKIAKVDVLFSS
jgi:hypothetical protein